MHFIKNLDKKDYMDFISNHPLAHYTKTPMWAELQKGVSHYVGLKQDNNLVATALILEKKWLGLTYFYIPAGPCIDFNNHSLFSTFNSHLLSFAKERKAFMVRMDPNVQRVSRDLAGNQTPDISNESITNLLINSGFKHKGYGYAYDGSWMNRFTLILDIEPDFDSIFSGFIKSRQNRLRRHDLMGISTRIASIEELPHLCTLERDLAQHQGFKPHSVSFFKKLLNSFEGYSRFYLTEVNLVTLYENTLDELNSKKYAKDKEAYESKKNSLKEIEVLRKQFGEKAVIAGGITLYFNNQSWNLYLYNKKEFTFLNGSDNTHIFSIKDLKEQSISHYDLCGFSGVVDKKDPYYGLYNYKSSFGTQFIERIGEFDLIISQKKYNFFFSTYRFYSRLRRKINHKRYKK